MARPLPRFELGSLPRDSERDAALVDVREPERHRDQIVHLAAVVQQMDGFTYADAERVCFEAVKGMVLAGQRELTTEIVQVELDDQRARIRHVHERVGG